MYKILIILIVIFTLNGCVIDRIKQRIYAKKMAKYYTNKAKYNSLKEKTKPKLYKPSPSPLIESSEVSKPQAKIKKKKKSIKKRVTYKKTKVRKKVNKIEPEPFTLDSPESDPELLGPQTTLKSNPLIDKKKKEEDVKLNENT